MIEYVKLFFLLYVVNKTNISFTIPENFQVITKESSKDMETLEFCYLNTTYKQI